jgi:hypothetical protein
MEITYSGFFKCLVSLQIRAIYGNLEKILKFFKHKVKIYNKFRQNNFSFKE